MSSRYPGYGSRLDGTIAAFTAEGALSMFND